MFFQTTVQIEVQEADSIELWDYSLPDDFDMDPDLIDLVEELDMGKVFPLDSNGVIIEPVHGIHEMLLEFNTEDGSVNVLEREVIEEYDDDE